MKRFTSTLKALAASHPTDKWPRLFYNLGRSDGFEDGFNAGMAKAAEKAEKAPQTAPERAEDPQERAGTPSTPNEVLRSYISVD